MSKVHIFNQTCLLYTSDAADELLRLTKSKQEPSLDQVIYLFTNRNRAQFKEDREKSNQQTIY